jgi:hypothetical protein
MTLPRLLTLMGSGETAPTMMKVHRDLIDRLGGKGTAAVVLDTPYGFQENAPELAERAVEYFAKSVQRPIAVAGLLRLDDVDPVVREQGLQRLRAADYVFAGPGSPTYSLRQWLGSAVPGILAEKLARGGGVTFASAAALTLGRFTVPVYEIYKVGMEPCWLEGLDVLGPLGLNVAIIPHYDNAEGGHHDTRFCYLGERRLAMLEAELPADAHVLGVDEHTGVILDLDADTATVVGNGTLTVRVSGASTIYPAGSVLPIDALRHPGAATGSPRPAAATPTATQAGRAVADDAVLTSLGAETDRWESAFAVAMNDGDATGAARAALELDQAITNWSADTLQSDEGDRARAALRSMISRLGDAAIGGLRDPREPIAPFIEQLIALRATVRADGRYDLSDQIRDGLTERRIELQDTREGPVWQILG